MSVPAVDGRPVRWPAKLPLFGVGVSVTAYEELADAILDAARSRRRASVNFLAVHGLMTATHDATFRRQLEEFEAVAPDGQPVRFALNLLHQAGLRDRVRAVQLTLLVCERAAREGVKIYLFGSRPDVVEALETALRRRFPRLDIVGREPGIYGSTTPAEHAAVVGRINGSGAAIVLVGLGCPHQERFAYQHRGDLDLVQLCVGSVFDIVSGKKRNAPMWMQRGSLEWLFRLAQEPARLWKRNLVTNSQFVARLLVAVIRREGTR